MTWTWRVPDALDGTIADIVAILREHTHTQKIFEMVRPLWKKNMIFRMYVTGEK